MGRTIKLSYVVTINADFTVCFLAFRLKPSWICVTAPRDFAYQVLFLYNAVVVIDAVASTFF